MRLRSRLEFAKALADDYVVRSNEKVTWASYRGWWMVFMEFVRFVGVDQGGGAEDWRMSVEVLRFACAMMAKEYALGTMKTFVSAVSFLFQNEGVAGTLHKRKVPDDDAGPRARDIGDREIKKPPVELEARHVAGSTNGHGQAYRVDAAAVAAGEGGGAVGLAVV